MIKNHLGKEESMNNIKTFTNEKFGKIRTTVINGEPWFVGKDITDRLGYRNGSRDIKRHCAESDRRKLMIFDGKQNKGSLVINESGLYSLVLSSKLPSAKEFKHWVTSEVLPAIRRDGVYMTDEKAFEVVHNPDGLADLLQQAAEQLREKDIEIERMRPKEIFSDAITASNTSILVGDLAKILKGNGVDIGQKRLFNWMREHGYLIKGQRSDRNMPTQRSMDMGLFEIKESSYISGDGVNHITKTPKVTGKGQKYFVNKFLAMQEAEEEEIAE